MIHWYSLYPKVPLKFPLQFTIHSKYTTAGLFLWWLIVVMYKCIIKLLRTLRDTFGDFSKTGISQWLCCLIQTNLEISTNECDWDYQESEAFSFKVLPIPPQVKWVSSQFHLFCPKIFKYYRIVNYRVHIFDQHEKCIKMSTSKHMVGAVVLTKAWYFLKQSIFF